MTRQGNAMVEESTRSRRTIDVPEGLWISCQKCGQMIYRRILEEELHVCNECGHHYRIDAQRRIDQLSGGQCQRVALARAIVFDPQILLMDEPLSALDKKLREQMQIEIRHLHEKLGRTTVYVTHDQREALTMSDRVAVIDFGQFKQIDAPKDLYERPRSKFVADFIGESSFLPVEVNGSSIDLDGATLRLGEPPMSSDKRQLLVIRPEKLEVLADGDGRDLNTLVGTVKELVYQGESFLFYVALSGGIEIAVRSPSRSESLAAVPGPGEPIRLGLHPADTIVVPDDR